MDGIEIAATRSIWTLLVGLLLTGAILAIGSAPDRADDGRCAASHVRAHRRRLAGLAGLCHDGRLCVAYAC